MQTGEVLDLFLSESDRYLRGLEKILFEADDAGRPSDAAVREMFRIVHTLKGSCAMMGFARAAQTAHAFEDVLAYARDAAGTQALPDGATMRRIVNAGFEFVEYMRQVLDAAAKGRSPDGLAVSGDHIEALRAELAPAGEPAAPVGAEAPAPVAGYRRMRVYLKPCEMAAMRAYLIFRAVRARLPECYTFPANLQRSPQLDAEVLAKGFELGFLPREECGEDAVRALVAKQVNFDRLEMIADAPAARDDGPKGEASAMTSVSQAKLNALIDLLGDVAALEANLRERIKASGDDAADRLLRQIQRYTADAQRSLGELGLSDIGALFSRMRRLARNALQDLNKDAEVRVTGEETPLDKDVAEVLGDVLMHIVRNAADHGIETPEERAKAGKPARGLIALEAAQRGGRVEIAVSDDGRGVERAKVLGKARERGLLDGSGDDLSDDQVYGFLFQNGFSTNERAGRYSGRGVGLDFAVNALRAIGGSLKFSSSPGAGTRVLIDVPVSMTLVDAMRVTVGARDVYLQTGFVRRVISAKDCEETPDGETLRYDGVSYRRLRLDMAGSGEVIALIECEGEKCALECDAAGEYGVVFVRRLPPLAEAALSERNVYCGCATDRLGSVLMVLDTYKLVKLSLKRGGVAMKMFTHDGFIKNDVTDALSELGNVGAGKATSALGNMLGERITLGTPSVLPIGRELAAMLSPEPDKLVMGILMTLNDNLNGVVIILVDLDMILNLVRKLTGLNCGNAELLENEDCLSTVQEIANIMASSYMTAIGEYTGLRIYMTPVMAGIDNVTSLIEYPLAKWALNCNAAICIKTTFQFIDDPRGRKDRGGYIVILPDEDSLKLILEALDL